jgi:hypothetical protein
MRETYGRNSALFFLTTSADGAPLALLNHAIHLAQLDQEDQHLCAGRNECHIDAADSAWIDNTSSTR